MNSNTVQDSVFDLDSMERVTLVKPVPEFVPVSSTNDALTRLGNDTARFLRVVNEGLESEEKANVKNDTSIPWQVEEEDGTLSPFEGTPANEIKVNGLILNLAKSCFNYVKNMSPDPAKSKAMKSAAKAAAMDMIKNTPAIVERLKTSAAA